MTDFNSMLEGKLPPPADFPAKFAFSLHKMGSTLMFDMIAQAASIESIPCVSIPDILFREGVLQKDWTGNEGLLPCFTDGRIYTGFRFLPRFLAREGGAIRSRRSVLLVRDPRDALVSRYFSFSGSHVLPEKNRAVYQQRFESVSHRQIDEYVLASAPNCKRNLVVYLQHIDFQSTKVFRYEDIVFDKLKFLREIFQHFELPVSEATLVRVAEQNDVRPAVEDARAHIRKVTPGDHREKLRPETIARLDSEFGDVCSRLGYRLA